MAVTPTVGGTVVLDAEGLSKVANNDPEMQARLISAKRRDARLVVNAITIAEVLRDAARDANLNRLLKKLPIIDVDSGIAREAGVLLGGGSMTGTAGNPTIDAIVAVTALRSERPTVVYTSDPDDLRRLLDGSDVTVVKV